MVKQLLYYKRAVPVSAQRHRGWSLEALSDYEFAGRTQLVPLVAAEFPAAATEYAIVFTGSEEAVQPAVILGLKPDENLYVDEQRKWNASYIPAFVRRYPFVFSRRTDGAIFTLCIDEESAGWNQEGRGKPLFGSNGDGTNFLNTMFRFVANFQRQLDGTLEFCRKLKELDLLEPMAARFKLSSGQMGSLTGFMAIDRDKLKVLPGDKLAELSKSGELEFMYLHLQSMRNFAGMLARITGDEPDRESWNELTDGASEKPVH